MSCQPVNLSVIQLLCDWLTWFKSYEPISVGIENIKRRWVWLLRMHHPFILSTRPLWKYVIMNKGWGWCILLLLCFSSSAFFRLVSQCQKGFCLLQGEALFVCLFLVISMLVAVVLRGERLCILLHGKSLSVCMMGVYHVLMSVIL